jgi:nicotinate-nucleotide adenylyltransferase
MNLGIFGGTFDPIHMGHLIIAESVREQEHLDRIIFVPSFVSPHKQGIPVSAATDRLAMVRAAVASNSSFEVSDVEIAKGGISFTVDTLRILKAAHPADRFHLLIGADNMEEFATWKNPAGIVANAGILVMRRPGFSGKTPEGELFSNIRFCEVPEIGISSTDIRRRISGGESIRYLVPEAVERYISEKHLYGSTPRG